MVAESILTYVSDSFKAYTIILHPKPKRKKKKRAELKVFTNL